MEDNYTYDQAALSRSEADLNADVQDPEPKYDQPPLSRIEYLLQQISGGVSSGIHLKGVVASASELPENAENGDMYFVGPDADGAYREVVWLDSKEDWEELGYNAIDVDAFVKKDGDMMAGPLYETNDGAQMKFTRFLHLGFTGYYEAAIETYLDSDRGETATAIFNQLVNEGTTTVMQAGVSPYNGAESGAINSVGFQAHWHGQGPSWNIPSNSYYKLSDNEYTVILDDAVAIRKRNVIYADEIGYVPIVFKGSVERIEDLPSNPENGWTYTVGDDTFTYSSELGEWGEPATWQQSSSFKQISQQMTHSAVMASDTSSDDYIELDEAGLLRDDTYVPKGYIEHKIAEGVSDGFEASLLSYIDSHTVTQVAYDALTDKTGFWLIKEATT